VGLELQREGPLQQPGPIVRVRLLGAQRQHQRLAVEEPGALDAGVRAGAVRVLEGGESGLVAHVRVVQVVDALGLQQAHQVVEVGAVLGDPAQVTRAPELALGFGEVAELRVRDADQAADARLVLRLGAAPQQRVAEQVDALVVLERERVAHVQQRHREVGGQLRRLPLLALVGAQRQHGELGLAGDTAQEAGARPRDPAGDVVGGGGGQLDRRPAEGDERDAVVRVEPLRQPAQAADRRPVPPREVGDDDREAGRERRAAP